MSLLLNKIADLFRKKQFFHFLALVQEISLVVYILITYDYVFINIYKLNINITFLFVISAVILSLLLLLLIFVSIKKYILLASFRMGFIITLILYMIFIGGICQLCLNYHILVITFSIILLFTNRKLLTNKNNKE